MDATCPLCAAAGEDVLWHDAFCRVILVDEPAYPGYCRVILNAHAREMTDLDAADRQRLMEVVWAAEAALREVCTPDKVNLASLGNVVPHLHWHVIPRHAGDPCFPDAVWATPRNPGAPDVLPAGLRPRLLAALVRRLGPAPG